MMIIFHDKCKTGILLNLTEGIKVITGFGIGSRYLKVAGGDIEFDESSFTPKFYCSSCKKDVDENELKAMCSNCGHLFPLNEVFREGDVGGVYCENCSTSSGRGNRLSNIIKRVSL